MLHRVFIAINLPEDIKNILVSFQDKYPQLPARWVNKENIHITLNFLGNLDDNQLLETINTVKEVVSNHSPFLLRIKKVVFGPPKKIPPRFVWAETESTKELSSFQVELEEKLFRMPSYQYKTKENRSFCAHITLARIKAFDFRRAEPEGRTNINEDLDLCFEVSAIEVMESRLKRSGAEYEILESVALKE